MTQDRVLGLIQKLLPVTDPASKSTPQEQENAARKVCQLILEHRLVLRHPPPLLSRPMADDTPLVSVFRRQKTEATMGVVSRYRKSRAAGGAHCGNGNIGCGGMVFAGEPVWRALKDGGVEYLHFGCLPPEAQRG